MSAIIADFLKTTPSENLPDIINFLMGSAFAPWSERELGVANKLMIKSLSKTTGVAEGRIDGMVRDLGDTGKVAEKICADASQTTLFTETLTVEKVKESLNKMSDLGGKGSQDKKMAYISEMLSSAGPVETRYVVKLILGELRLGVGEGVIKDAIVSAFGVSKELVENACNLTSDLGEVAATARKNGDFGLKEVGLKPGIPMKVMLAQKISGIDEAVEKLGRCAFEIKYDGMRIQIHKSKEEIKLFTRRLENVTKQFPELVKEAGKNINADSAIVEGELVAIEDNRKPRPFQDLSRRIKRKYDIEDMVESVPIEINLFDLVFLNGESLLECGFSKRHEKLKGVINETGTFRIAEEVVTDDCVIAQKFYDGALAMGHEGVMVKNLDAPYKPGSRVGYMYKIKPVMETLDLVITGATWGEGRRANWFGSFLISARDEVGGFCTIGRLGTGFTDEVLAEITETLKPLVLEEAGKEVVLKPGVVVEVAYEEIQKSPSYTSGYALRFPRLVRIRDDKGAEDADTVARVEQIASA